MKIIGEQLSFSELLVEVETVPAITFTMYHGKDYEYECPCGFCGRDAKPYHPEGYFWRGFQAAVCAKCHDRKKPPRDEWKLV